MNKNEKWEQEVETEEPSKELIEAIKSCSGGLFNFEDEDHQDYERSQHLLELSKEYLMAAASRDEAIERMDWLTHYVREEITKDADPEDRYDVPDYSFAMDYLSALYVSSMKFSEDS